MQKFKPMKIPPPIQQAAEQQKVVVNFAIKIFCTKFSITREQLLAKGGSRTLKDNRLRFIQILSSPPCSLRINQIARLMGRDDYSIINSLMIQDERFKFSLVERGIIAAIQKDLTNKLKSYMILKPLENVHKNTTQA